MHLRIFLQLFWICQKFCHLSWPNIVRFPSKRLVEQWSPKVALQTNVGERGAGQNEQGDQEGSDHVGAGCGRGPAQGSLWGLVVARFRRCRVVGAGMIFAETPSAVGHGTR